LSSPAGGCIPREHHEHFSDLRSSLSFGYFHDAIFAAAGAFSAGTVVAVLATEIRRHNRHNEVNA
jgi:hypothetical protein